MSRPNALVDTRPRKSTQDHSSRAADLLTKLFWSKRGISISEEHAKDAIYQAGLRSEVVVFLGAMRDQNVFYPCQEAHFGGVWVDVIHLGLRIDIRIHLLVLSAQVASQVHI